MSCANNFRMKDKNYSNINYRIPCRYCINCREDRRREWKARADYEFKKHISGTFLTLTYDDNNLMENIVRGNDEKLRANLNYKDVKKFILRLKKYIERNEKKNNILRQKDFTYLGVGEYGENGTIWDRPHWHILMFGLDWKYNEKLFEQEWGKGIVDSKPILTGGINYVLKYMDKQIMGKKEIWENYGRFGLNAPKQFQSTGLGSGLYKENLEEAVKNNGIIKDGLKQFFRTTILQKKIRDLLKRKRSNREKNRKPKKL